MRRGHPVRKRFRASGGKVVTDLRRLTYFLAVAEELHFGRAAARLDIAQPPLSRQVAQLEKDLGIILIDRSRNQIRLTQAGAVLMERARDILEQVERTGQEVRRIGEGIAGRLRIAFVGSATHGILPNIIMAFRDSHPDVELALSAMNNAELKRALIQREIDLAVARPSLVDDELKSVPLHHEPLVLALPNLSKLNGTDGIHLAALKGETFVLYPRHPRPSFADHILNICRDEGFIPKSQVLAQDYQIAISLVAVGAGLSLVPASVSQSDRPGVAFRNYVGENPGTALSLNFRRDNQTVHVLEFLKVAAGFKT